MGKSYSIEILTVKHSIELSTATPNRT